MLLYKKIAQIYLVLSIHNLVLAAPIVQRTTSYQGSEADLEMGASAATMNAAAVPNDPKSGDLEAPSNRLSTSQASSSSAMATPEHSPSVASSGYPTPHLSETSSVSGHSWMLDRPPRPDPYHPPPKLDGLELPHNPGSESSAPSEALEEDMEPISKKKLLTILLGTWGTLGGGAWLLNKFIIGPRDCEDC
jgi:hypothetical protein